MGFLAGAVLLSLAACKVDRNQVLASEPGGPGNGSVITLSLLNPAGDIRGEGSIHLLVENQSSRSIALADDFGARLFAYSAGRATWLEIENQVSYLPPDEPYVLAPMEQTPFNQKVFRVSPGFGDVTDAGILRIVVTGTLLEGNIPGTEQVTALIELEIGE